MTTDAVDGYLLFGRLGVKLGLFQPETLRLAVDRQLQIEASGTRTAFGEVCVTLTMLTAEQRNRLLAHQAQAPVVPEGTYFGYVALVNGFVTAEQLEEALNLQEIGRIAGTNVPKLGDVLSSLSVMSEHQIQAVLRAQVRLRQRASVPAGQIAGQSTAALAQASTTPFRATGSGKSLSRIVRKEELAAEAARLGIDLNAPLEPAGSADTEPGLPEFEADTTTASAASAPANGTSQPEAELDFAPAGAGIAAESDDQVTSEDFELQVAGADADAGGFSPAGADADAGDPFASPDGDPFAGPDALADAAADLEALQAPSGSGAGAGQLQFVSGGDVPPALGELDLDGADEDLVFISPGGGEDEPDSEAESEPTAMTPSEALAAFDDEAAQARGRTRARVAEPEPEADLAPARAKSPVKPIEDVVKAPAASAAASAPAREPQPEAVSGDYLKRKAATQFRGRSSAPVEVEFAREVPWAKIALIVGVVIGLGAIAVLAMTVAG